MLSSVSLFVSGVHFTATAKLFEGIEQIKEETNVHSNSTPI